MLILMKKNTELWDASSAVAESQDSWLDKQTPKLALECCHGRLICFPEVGRDLMISLRKYKDLKYCHLLVCVLPPSSPDHGRLSFDTSMPN